MSALDTAEKWEEVCRQTCIQAAFIRVAALWAEEVKGQQQQLYYCSNETLPRKTHTYWWTPQLLWCGGKLASIRGTTTVV